VTGVFYSCSVLAVFPGLEVGLGFGLFKFSWDLWGWQWDRSSAVLRVCWRTPWIDIERENIMMPRLMLKGMENIQWCMLWLMYRTN